MMRVLIVANGAPPTSETAQACAARNDLTIAVDGAVYAAQSLGLTPDVLTGDFDSVRLGVISDTFPNLKVIGTPDQDQSDLEKAIGVAIDLGATEITVIGAAGGRMDHTLANFAILLGARVPICLADDFGTVQMVVSDGAGDGETSVSLEASPGNTVSLITFDSSACVSIEGVQWPLRRFNLLPGTRGVSNVALGSMVEIAVHRGSVYVCQLQAEPIRRHSVIPDSKS